MSHFAELPDDTRLWIFQADRELSSAEQSAVEESLESFLAGWNAHGKKLAAAAEVRYKRFLVIAADESKAAASGCSIDDMFHHIRDLGAKISIDFFDRTQLAYRLEGENTIHTVPLSEFSDRVASLGKENLTVFNNLIDKKKELDHHWETTIDTSWHAQLL